MAYPDDMVTASLYAAVDPALPEGTQAEVGAAQTIVWNAPPAGDPGASSVVLFANDFDGLTAGSDPITVSAFRLAVGDPKLNLRARDLWGVTVVPVLSHGKVLRHTIPIDAYGYASQAGTAFYAQLPQAVKEARLSYLVKVQASDFGRGLKLPGLGGVDLNILPSRVTGLNGPSRHGWSSRLALITPTSNPGTSESPAELAAYRYWPDQPNDWGATIQTDVPIESGTWYRVEQYVKLNTVGVADGVHEIVVDGVTVYSDTAFEWRKRNDVLISHLFWHVYRGGDKAGDSAYGVNSETAIDFDELEITAYNTDATTPTTSTSDPLTWVLTGEQLLTSIQTWAADGVTPLETIAISEYLPAGGSYSATLEYDSADGKVELTETAETTNTHMRIEVLDPTLERAPTSATVALMGGYPDTPVDFYIDGDWVASAYTDGDGQLEPLSIPVAEPLGSGSHTVTAEQEGSNSPTATFSLKYDPNLALVAIGPDADPVDVPGSVTDHGTRKWIFQDLMPDGLGSWVMPINPADMTSPFVENALQSRHTTSRADGQWHISQGGTIPREWTFSGRLFDKESYEQLQAYRGLNRRFYIIDHRGRAWISVITDIDWDFDLQKNFNGEQTNWAAKYQATVTTFNQDPQLVT